MNPQETYSTLELGSLKLRLRDTLTFSVQDYSGHVCYVIEDEARTAFYRIGVPEYNFISLLDGNTTIAEAVALTAAKLGEDAFSEHNAAAICKWLIETELATTPESASAARLLQTADQQSSRKWKERLNPISIRIPLFNPDAALDSLYRRTRWLFSSAMLVVWLGVIGFALMQLISHWAAFRSQAETILSPWNWLALGVCWLGLKLLHELGHGLVCKRYGGRVREGGLVCILFMPMPFVDVTSSWRFPSKWQRVFTSAAGMIVELFIAALALIVWTQTGPGMVNQQAYNLILTASFVTVVFNLNPLMKFDGYYILSDLLELPNLAGHANQWLMSKCRRFFFGIPGSPPTWPEGKAFFVKSYALAAFCWRILLCVSLVIGAAFLFHGAGLILAIIAVGLWLILPMCRLLRFLVVGSPISKPKRLRFAVICTMLFGGLFLTGTKLTWQERRDVPAVVEFEELNIVRTPHAGFVSQIHVQSGDEVQAGQLLLELHNPLLTSEIAQLQLAIQQSELKNRMFLARGEITASQTETVNRTALETKLAERLKQQTELKLHAPVSGKVIAENLDTLAQTWMKPGQEILQIGDEVTKHVTIVVHQSDLEIVRDSLHQPVEMVFWGMLPDTLSGELSTVEPRATSQLPHPALSANTGGSVTVRMSKQPNSRNPWEMTEPHLIGRVTLNEEAAQYVKAGQTGYVRFPLHKRPVGEIALESMRSWWKQKLTAREKS